MVKKSSKLLPNRLFIQIDEDEFKQFKEDVNIAVIKGEFYFLLSYRNFNL
jgi:hypothetical protein